MTSHLVNIITSDDPNVRDLSLAEFAQSASLEDLLAECDALEAFRRRSDNLYERVRACFFLYAIHRFHLPAKAGLPVSGHLPFESYLLLLERRFEEALGCLLQDAARTGTERHPVQRPGRRVPSAGLSDAGRSGAAQRPLGARQPVDVSARAIPPISRCASAPELLANGAPAARSPSCAKPRPSAWT